METTKKIIIAIDGHSSTGKSTVAKQLAKHLGYTYIDTGAMYRSVSLYALQQNYIVNNIINETALNKDLDHITIEFKKNITTEVIETFLNEENVESKIRGLEVSNYVSDVAAISKVRRFLVLQQQKMGEQKGIVMDGRDIGTVVFPEAELKLFMTASAEIRAKRRFDELTNKGEEVSFIEVLENVQKRDFVDSNREDSPLMKAKDAYLIDNSALTRTEQFEYILELVRVAENKV